MQAAVAGKARGLMFVRLLVMAALFFAGGFLWLASVPDAPTHTRVSAALGALLCLVVPARVLYVGARRYAHTGKWTIPLEERDAWRQRYTTQVGSAKMEPVWTTLVVLLVLLNLIVTAIVTAIRMRRHGSPMLGVLMLIGWSVFLAPHIRKLYRQLRPPSEHPVG